MYFEVTELTAGEIGKCFDQKDLSIVRDIESLLLGFANGNASSYTNYCERVFAKEVSKIVHPSLVHRHK